MRGVGVGGGGESGFVWEGWGWEPRLKKRGGEGDAKLGSGGV